MSVDEDGVVELQRRVVAVEEQGQLNLRFKAVQLGDTDTTESSSGNRFENEMKFTARSAFRSERYIQNLVVLQAAHVGHLVISSIF